MEIKKSRIRVDIRQAKALKIIKGKEDVKMAKKITSKDVASKASKVLRDGRTSKDSKACAASALSQRENKKKKQSAELRPRQTIY